VIFSQAVLLKLVDKGLSREEAYKLVQSNAMKAWNKRDGDFKANLLADQEVTAKLSNCEIEECFNPQNYLKNLDHVFQRLGI
jgi:adenylosuccinate lyase